MKIVCDNKIPFLRGVLEPFAEVVYLPGKETGPDVVRDADALVTRTRTACGESLLAGSSVKVIATATIGFDHIDTAWCDAHGIVWRNAPGCNSGSVMQYVTALLLQTARRHGFALAGKTLGVVGVGNVGRKVAAAAEALGMRVLRNDPPRARLEGPEGFVSLDEILERSDIITLHVPLSRTGEDATWHLFDAALLARMRPDQVLLNSSRGPVVDNAALKAALKTHRIAGASLDVWEGEPDFDRELMDLLDFATPHIAGYSADGKAGGTTASVRTVAEVLDLPLRDWTASGVPAPAQPLAFSIDAAGKDAEAVLEEAVRHTYDIASDDRALRADPRAFERLRGDYPVRREFQAFTLTLRGAAPAVADSLTALGFKLIQQ